MASKFPFKKLKSWFRTNELFLRPSKLIVGKWQLYEYYIDEDEKLKHYEEEELKHQGQRLVVSILQDENVIIANNLPVPVVGRLEDGTWSVSKNFITFIHPNNFRNSVEFQFAFNKGVLKLLKKDEFGNIEFFGFFNRIK